MWEEEVETILQHDLVQDSLESIKESEWVSSALNHMEFAYTSLLQEIDDLFDEGITSPDEVDYIKVAKPELDPPAKQPIAVYNLEIGDTQQQVKEELGEPNRSTTNEYGALWHTYHQNYQHFLMISFDDNQLINGLYTNQDLISSSLGITLGDTKSLVQQNLGRPLTKIKKGSFYYQLPDHGEYDVFLIEKSYVTVFYDIHENNTVTAIQIIQKELEDTKQTLYTENSDELKTGLEYQLFDVTNAARVEHGLHPLAWDDSAKETARKHSLDMADNGYFDHTNLDGESPFDRMSEDNIHFLVAGENLAYGQFSSIFAHEGLMNSEGHRKNILQKDFDYVGIGVAFNEESHPYYTQNYFAN